MAKLTENMVLMKSKASCLPKIRKLNLWACDLEDISVVQKLSNLIVALISCNKVSSLADFASCSNLEELYARNNSISCLAEVVHLRNLPKLRVLWLEGNPCSDLPNYRQTVISILPHLQRLDNQAVEDAEIVQASEFQLDDNSLGDTVICNSKLESVDDVTVSQPKSIENGSQQQQQQQQMTDAVNVSVSKADDVEASQSSSSTAVVRDVYPKVVHGTDPNHHEAASPNTVRSKASIANILNAILGLLPELDRDDLEAVSRAVSGRLELK